MRGGWVGGGAGDTLLGFPAVTPTPGTDEPQQQPNDVPGEPVRAPEPAPEPEVAAPESAQPPGPGGAPRRRSRYVQAVLSTLLPGLGHLIAGRWRLALIFGLPVVLLAVALVALVATTDRVRLAATLVQPEVIWGLLALQFVVLAWRLVAVASSLLDPALPRPGRRDALPIAVLLVAIVAPQAYAGYLTNVARETSDQIFVEETSGGAWQPSPAPSPSPSPGVTPSVGPGPSVAPSPSPSVERITGLIVGVDAGAGRRTYLTDTMIVVSLDPLTETVSMLSIPRDMVDVPLPDGRVFPGKINGLVSYARRNPDEFPGADGTGRDVLMGALGTLLGMRIDYYALVHLGGFVRVVDTVGGIDVYVERGFCDPSYDEYGFSAGFSIRAGWHHLDGQQALAYARVRKASGESDFTRAARQQEVLSGIRDAIVRGAFLRDPVGLLRALGETVQTNVPRGILPDLAEIASRLGRDKTYRAVIRHPLVRSGSDARGYILVPDVEAIRELVAAIFPPAGQLPIAARQAPEPSTPKPSGGLSSGVGGCRPATPSPTPTPSPSPSPSVEPSPSSSGLPEASPSAGSSPGSSESPAASPTPTVSPSPSPTPAPSPSPS